jgi:hypothetical protein
MQRKVEDWKNEAGRRKNNDIRTAAENLTFFGASAGRSAEAMAARVKRSIRACGTEM